ncbi:MAG: cupin domain-containing protein [Gemmatimonadales bacterium]|nr:MAG: cupin domain-containing protein [Gemmatimonadales bacterium]
MKAKNLFRVDPDPAQPESGGERVDVLAESGAIRVERIVSSGHASPEGFWYDQDEAEWVALLAGEAILRFQDPDEEVHLRPGDHLLIPAHRRHRVEWTTPGERTIWLATFFPWTDTLCREGS